MKAKKKGTDWDQVHLVLVPQVMLVLARPGPHSFARVRLLSLPVILINYRHHSSETVMPSNKDRAHSCSSNKDGLHDLTISNTDWQRRWLHWGLGRALTVFKVRAAIWKSVSD